MSEVITDIATRGGCCLVAIAQLSEYWSAQAREGGPGFSCQSTGQLKLGKAALGLVSNDFKLFSNID